MQLLRQPQTVVAVRDSALIAALVSVLSLGLGYPAARVLALERFRGRRLVLALLFVPTVVPAVATGIGLNVVMLRLGLNGTLVAVALVHLVPTLPYIIFTLLGVFARYDPRWEHQARVLGARPWQVFWRVTLPLLRSGLVVAALFAFLISWSQYLLTLLVGSGQIITLPILLFTAVAGGNAASIAALALVFAAPLVVIIAAAARSLAAEQALFH